MEEAEELPGGPAEASGSREEAAGQGEAAAPSGRGRGGPLGLGAEMDEPGAARWQCLNGSPVMLHVSTGCRLHPFKDTLHGASVSHLALLS